MTASHRWTPAHARERLAAIPDDYVELLQRGEASLGFYVPEKTDTQAPHDRDELYFVASGTGTFVCRDERTPFAPGDALFVAARVPHRFEDFGDDFATWVVFFGPREP